MTTALELQSRGIEVLVMERNPSTTRHPKMDITNGRSMELFRRLGLSERIRDRAVPRENGMDVSFVTRLSEWELTRFKYRNVHEAREYIRQHNDGSQPLEPNMRLSQIVLEPVFREILDASPLVELRFGWAFEGFVEDADGVTVTALEVETGKRHEIRCRLLAGCDGGGSLVRQKLGFELEGEFNVARFYMVHFRSKDKQFLQRFGATWHYHSPTGATLIAQDDNEMWTMQHFLRPGTDEKSIDPKQLVYAGFGREFDLEILQANPWSPHLVYTTRCGRGRVWLAGDSVHQVILTGGYGMNTGIGDAVDLGWKFAAVLQGWGGPDLLESIDAERRPIAKFVADYARKNMEVGRTISKSYDPKIHENSEAGAEARAKLSKLIQSLGNAKNEALGVEMGGRYRDSPVICQEPNEPDWDHVKFIPSTWPGVRAPHVFLENGDAIFDLFGQGFTLVRFTDTDVGELLTAAQVRGLPLKLLDVRDSNAHKIYERDLILIRPDQYVAWRGNHVPSDPLAVIDRVRGARLQPA
jgi:2-polyprenyl-6-methoxyphenol hydroxylase-like FAD-dependent oxidoreductase